MHNARLLVMTVLALLTAPPLQAQNLIINGDFEINTAFECDFNLSNAQFNATVSNATAFGTAEETLIFFGVPGTGAWTMFSHTFTAPVNGSHLTLRPDLNAEVWNHVDNISLEATGGCLDVISQEVVCHADGTTFTVNIEGLNACTGGTTQVTFTGSGGAVGEELCFTILVNADGGFCCSTEICVIIPDCTPPDELGCPADLDSDNTVGINDYLIVMGTWGGPEGDTNGDGTTDILDFLAVLGTWGPCP